MFVIVKNVHPISDPIVPMLELLSGLYAFDVAELALCITVCGLATAKMPRYYCGR